MKFYLSVFALAGVCHSATVIVGTNRPLKSIQAGIDAMVPLAEDLYVYVEEPSLQYQRTQSISALSSWNGHAVKVMGMKYAPEITVYSGNDAVYEFNGASLSLAYENLTGPLGEEGRVVGDDPFFYVKDHLGSTRMTLNKDASIIEAVAYHSLGSASNLVAGGVVTREKFTGKEHDEDGAEGSVPGMNLDYFGARYYDADLGLWISPDAARQFHNLYSFGTNPVNSFDLDGNEVKGATEDRVNNLMDEANTLFPDRFADISEYYKGLEASKTVYQWDDVWTGFQNLAAAWGNVGVDYSKLQCNFFVQRVLREGEGLTTTYRASDFHLNKNLLSVKPADILWGDVLQWPGHVAINDPISHPGESFNTGARKPGYKSGVFPNSWWGTPKNILRSK